MTVYQTRNNKRLVLRNLTQVFNNICSTFGRIENLLFFNIIENMYAFFRKIYLHEKKEKQNKTKQSKKLRN